MKNQIVCFSFFLSSFCTAQTSINAERILAETSKSLSAIREVSLEHRRVIKYKSLRRFNEFSGNAYLDFRDSSNVMGARFYFTNSSYTIAYNGRQCVLTNNTKQEFELFDNPLAFDLAQFSFLNHSIYSLRNALPWIIQEAAGNFVVRDSAISGNDNWAISFLLTKGTIRSDGSRSNLTEDIDMKYTLLIKKENYLPSMIIQENRMTRDSVLTFFSNIQLSPKFDQTKFMVKSYIPVYKQVEAKAKQFSITSVDFTLPYVTKDSLSISNLKGNVVLIDFWINNCSPCIQIIPALHSFQNEFGNASFKLVSVNSYDDIEDIKSFLKSKPLINYPVLYGGSKVAENYGINGFPTIFLLNKSGKIIYKGDFKEEYLRKMIKENL